MSELIRWRAVTETTGAKVATKSEIEQLRTWQAEWKAAQAQIAANTYMAAKPSYERHQRELQQSLRAGKLDSQGGKTLEHWYTHHEALMAAAKAECIEICQKAVPVASAIVERWCDSANGLISDLERRDAAEASNFGVQYAPSPVITALREAVVQARRRIPQGRIFFGGSPQNLVPFVNLES